MREITEEKLAKYFSVTRRALKKVKLSPPQGWAAKARDVFDTSEMRGISERAQKSRAPVHKSKCTCDYCRGQVIFDMAQRYFSDAKHFRDKGEIVTAFAALNYAHGWLDAGARLGLLDVDHDDTLFTVDGKD